MNEQYKKIYDWLEVRTERERIFILLGVLLVIYFLWYLIIGGSLSQTYGNLSQQIEAAEQQIATLQKETVQLQSTAKKVQQASMLNENATLKLELARQQNQLSGYFQQLSNPQQAFAAMKALLAPPSDMILTSMENTPAQLLTSTTAAGNKAASGNTDSNKIATGNNSQKVFEHGIVLQFKGNYPATLAYLQQLEILPWYFMVDDLNYQVLHYPVATITFKLRVLSFQEKWLDV